MATPVKISVVVNAARARSDLGGITATVRNLARLRAPRLSLDTSSIKGAVKDYTSLGREARTSLANLDQTLDEVKRTGYRAFDGATVKLREYESTAQKTVGRLKAVAVATAAVAVAGRAIGATTNYLKGAVTAASDLSETSSKVGVVFGAGAKDILAFAKTADTALGQSQQSALDAASTFGLIGQKAGLTGTQTVAFSKQFTTLASDMASFSNTTPEEAIEAIGAAMRGEAEPIRKYGVLLDDATLRQTALRLGIIKTTKDALTPQQKALAASQAILDQTGKAQGDYARTSAGLANGTRSARAQLANLSATVGSALTPSLAALVAAGNTTVLPFLRQLAETYAPKVNRFLLEMANRLQNADLGKAFDDARTAVSGFFADINGGGGGAGGGNLAQLGAIARDVAASLSQLGGEAGKGVTDTLTVFGVVVKVAADHADLLARALPALVVAYGAVKAAQAAAQVADVARVPLKIADLAATRALTKSNIALAASQRAATTSTITGTTAETAATAAKSRGIVVTTAQRAAHAAAAVATNVLSVATRALGIAVRFAMGPVGLIITGITMQAAGLVYAYTHSETFRRIVDGAFRAVKAAASFAFDWIKRNWPLLLGILTGPVGIAITMFVKHRDKILGIFRGIKNSVVSMFRGIGGVITGALRAAINTAVDLVNLPIKAVNKVAGRLPGVPELPVIPRLATGGIVRARPGGVLTILGEGRYDEAVVPLRGNGFGGNVTINITMHVQSNDPDHIYDTFKKKLYRDGPGLVRLGPG